MKNIVAILVIFSTTLFHKYLCYPTGAPSSVCETMLPKHGSVPDVGPSPYEVKVEQTYYVTGNLVQLSIESSTDNITGFLIQARKVGENSVTGSFATPPTNTNYLTCNNNSKGAITHSQRLSVRTISFQWYPPVDLNGNVSFYATVVKSKIVYWVKLRSSELYKKVTIDETTTAAPTTAQVMEPIVYEDCIQAQEKTCNDSVNRIYSIKARTEHGYASLECLDSSILTNCPGSGWTKVGSLNGKTATPNTSFHSEAWTSKNTSYGFNVGFWSVYVGEVCFYTKYSSFVLPVHAPSLRSLFFGKKLVDVDKDQFTGNFFVDDCYEVGFNVGDPDFVVIRAGIVAVRNKTDCDLVPPAAIGVGIYNVTSPTMNNFHGYLDEDNLGLDDFIIAVRWRPEQ